MAIAAAFARLSEVSELDRELLARLRAWIDDAPDAELFRINLARWASAWGVPLRTAITHFLHLTRAGVMEMAWETHCTRCNAVLVRDDSLDKLRAAHWCDVCLIDVEVRLDDHIEVTFTVARVVREVAGRPPYERPAGVVVFAEVDVPAGTTRRVPVRVGATPRLRLMTWKPGTLNVVETAAVGGQPRLTLRDGETVVIPPSLPTGEFELEIVNDRAQPANLLLEDHDMPEYAASDLPGPRLGGLDVATVPAFRALFHTETLAQHESLAVRDVTLVFTDIERSTELYQRIGDVAAYALVRRHFDVLFAAVARHGGTVIKTIGDAVMASFVRSADAIEAFVSAQRAFADLGAAEPRLRIRVRAAIHRGPVIAVTLNDRLDFFGTTVNETARMETECAPGEIIVSDAALEAVDRRSVLAGCEVTSEMRTLAGLPRAYRLHRIHLSAP